MAPKKKTYNGFSMFMMETKDILAKKGIMKRMADMPSYCESAWTNMSDQEKEKYKIRGKLMKNDAKTGKYTSIGENVEDVKNRAIASKLQAEDMYQYIEMLVGVHPVTHYLPKQKFIFIHINPYTCQNEGFYFPAEISMAEFSLERGLIRIFHQIIGFDKDRTNAPPAPTADINTHAINNHKITVYMKFPNNYKDIFLKIIGFITEKDVDEDMLNDLDLPPIYTAHCSTENELMITTSSLYQLYRSSINNASRDQLNKLLTVYHLDKLFMELKNASHKIANPGALALPSVALATDCLTKDNFNTIKSIGCHFHDKIEYGHVCSNYYVCKWIYIFSTHCCQYFDIKLISGCHYDFDLSNSAIALENIFSNLNVSEKKIDPEKYGEFIQSSPKTLTANSFPALKGSVSESKQTLAWRREPKVNIQHTTIRSKDNNFPSLGNSQQTVPENSTKSQIMNSWRSGSGRGIINQTQNNTTQLSDDSKKPIKGSGLDFSDNKY